MRGAGGVWDGDPRATSSRTEVIHHEILFPYPMSNRDYVYHRRKAVKRGAYFSYIQRDLPPARGVALCPPRKGIVRAGNGRYYQFALGKAEPHGRSVMLVRTQDNFEGRMPLWLQHLAAKKVRPPTPPRCFVTSKLPLHPHFTRAPLAMSNPSKEPRSLLW